MCCKKSIKSQKDIEQPRTLTMIIVNLRILIDCMTWDKRKLKPRCINIYSENIIIEQTRLMHNVSETVQLFGAKL